MAKMSNVPLNLLRSYLRATGIKYTRSKVSGCDLTVECKDGGTIEVCVALSDEHIPPLEAVPVVGSHLTGKNRERALEAFYGVSRAAGYGEPMPFNRGAEPEHKLSYTDEEFLVSIRATETRRAPDPSPEKYKEYDKAMSKAVWNFFRLNTELCRRWSIDLDDLMQHARVLLVNFCARVEDDDLPKADNERMLYVYLRQRFGEYYSVLGKKERSVFPDADTVCIASTGIPYQDGQLFGETPLRGYIDPTAEPEQLDIEHRERNRKLDCSSPTKRKASAAKMLSDSLSSMDHEQMVEVLSFAMQNILIAHDARREAKKRLRAHAVTCTECQKNTKLMKELELGVEEDEDAAGADSGSSEE